MANKNKDFKCLCENPDCAKCLSINCLDDNCKVHTQEKKEAFAKRWERTHDNNIYSEAKDLSIKKGYASPALFKRTLHIDYARATNLLDLLENEGVIEPADGAKPRKVIDPSKPRIKYTNEELFDKAKHLVRKKRFADASILKETFHIGYARATLLLEELEEKGIINPADGAKPRKVIK